MQTLTMAETEPGIIKVAIRAVLNWTLNISILMMILKARFCSE
jgi:hypothetical protein